MILIPWLWQAPHRDSGIGRSPAQSRLFGWLWNLVLYSVHSLLTTNDEISNQASLIHTTTRHFHVRMPRHTTYKNVMYIHSALSLGVWPSQTRLWQSCHLHGTDLSNGETYQTPSEAHTGLEEDPVGRISTWAVSHVAGLPPELEHCLQVLSRFRLVTV